MSDWKQYVSKQVLADNILITTIAFGLGVVSGAFHTALSLMLGLLVTLLLRMFLVDHTLMTILLSVSYYIAGYLIGGSIYTCNKHNPPWKPARFPWQHSGTYKLFAANKNNSS